MLISNFIANLKTPFIVRVKGCFFGNKALLSIESRELVGVFTLK